MQKKRFPHKDNVLLVNITRLGDMLQATPTIAGMKQENPNCKVTVLVEKQFEDVCHWLPHIDQVKSLDLGMTVRSLAREQEGIVDAYEYVTEFVHELRKEKFDYCLNMSSSAYTALLLRLVGIERNGGWTSDDEGYRVIESDWAKLFASSVFHQNRQFNSLNLVDVFRCSADVEQHPRQLQITIDKQALEYCETMLREAAFTNSGPLIALQAGASQEKRQWIPANFARLINVLHEKARARIVLTGTAKELPILEKIRSLSKDPSNILIAAGKTNIPQLAALLKLSDILVTGDTGTMHMSVAAGTPVVAMFLASAFGFETGPYSEGNIVLQPIIECGPCNPNKPCSGLECHDTYPPELVAELTLLRLAGDVTTLPERLSDHRGVMIYRSFFDRYGFCDLQPLNPQNPDPLRKFRDAYRQVWLSDLGGFPEVTGEKISGRGLKVMTPEVEGLSKAIALAERGKQVISELSSLILDTRAPGQKLGHASAQLAEIDREIEQTGFHYSFLGPVTRMFVFSKENLSGTDPLDLASQTGRNYEALGRRCVKLQQLLS